MDICSFCLQPGNLFTTGESSTFACAKCQPYVQNTEGAAENSSEYNSAIEPQVIVDDGNQASAEDFVRHCNFCNKTFEKNLQYQNHMRNHRAERKYVCPHCTKGFSQSNNLRAHLRIHTNERPYKCYECGKAFTQVTNLNNHIRLHTGEKPFACTEPGCDKAFAQVTNLNNHRKSHMRDFRTYTCRVCSKSFAQRNHLTMHVASAHGSPGWATSAACKACGEAFPSGEALLAHVRNDCKEQETLKKTATNRGQNTRVKPVAASGSIKCLFGDCKMYFESMASLHSHLSIKHGLTINTKAKPKPSKSIDYSNEIIEIDDDETPSKSNSPSQSHQNSSREVDKNNGRTMEHEVKQEKESSQSESSSDSSDQEEDDSDSRESDRRKSSRPNTKGIPRSDQGMKLVCNICFSTFDNMALLETHVEKKH